MKSLLLLLFMFIGIEAIGQQKAIGKSLLSLSSQIIEKKVLKNQEKLTAGDIVILAVTLPDDMKSAEPEFSQKLTDGPLEWGSGRVLGMKKSENSVEIALTTYKPGPFTISPIHFVLNGEFVAVTEPKTVEYAQVEQKPPGIKEKFQGLKLLIKKFLRKEEPTEEELKETVQAEEDIYEPEKVSVPTWIYVLISFVLLVMILTVWIYLYKKSKTKVAPQTLPIKRLNPIDEYNKAAGEILAKDLLSKSNFKPYYFGLSECAKRFIGRAFLFDAEDKTTRELIYEMRVAGVKENLIESWKVLFDEMDETKFTDLKPDPEKYNTLASRLSDVVNASWKTTMEYFDLIRTSREVKK